MKTTVHIEGLADLQRSLIALGKEAQKSGGPVKNAVRKSANVIRDQMKRNMAIAIADPNAPGSRYENTGRLLRYTKSMRVSGHMKVNGETYIAGVVGKSKYPDGTTVKRVGGYFEYGTRSADGRTKIKEYRPLRRAWATEKDRALTVMVEEAWKGVRAIERKVAK